MGADVVCGELSVTLPPHAPANTATASDAMTPTELRRAIDDPTRASEMSTIAL
jgi:hypothetical protein